MLNGRLHHVTISVQQSPWIAEATQIIASQFLGGKKKCLLEYNYPLPEEWLIISKAGISFTPNNCYESKMQFMTLEYRKSNFIISM